MVRSLAVALVATIAAAATGWAKDQPSNSYALAQPPLEVFDSLAELPLGSAPSLPAAERQFLGEVWQWRTAHRDSEDAQPDDALVLEALLWASGVEDDAARQKYREEFAGIVERAGQAVAAAKDDRQRGELLMQHLHATVMHGGYREEQTSFAAVLDRGEFNCVSSTAVYQLVGTRLGLKLRPYSIPGNAFLAGHASLDLLDGRNLVQVEPTNPDGFDWATKIKRPGVLAIGFVPDRKDGHPTDALGIAAAMYANRGVSQGKRDRDETPTLDGARCYLAALALDPTNSTATHNLLSIFINGGPALAKDERYEDGVRVLEFGMKLAPGSHELRDNLTHVWSQSIDAALESGEDQRALELVRRAAESASQERDFRRPARWFERHAERRLRDDGWEAGLTAAERGLQLLEGAEAKDLRGWRSGLFRRWSQSLLDDRDVDGSRAVLARAYALDPADKEIHDGLVFHLQRALELLDDGEPAAMIAHFEQAIGQFPRVKDLPDVGRAHAHRALRELTDAGNYAEALAAAERYEPLIVGKGRGSELGTTVYLLWGQKLAEAKQWQPALDKYAAGLAAYPGEQRLLDAAAAAVDGWAAAAIEAQDWDAAIKIYQTGLADYAPGHRGLLHNKEYCESMKAGK